MCLTETVHFLLLVQQHNGMSSLKIVLASQAIYINKYKHLKQKLLKCCANIYFNKQCLIHGLIPKFANVRVPNTSPAATFTKRKMVKMRLRDELKFLYIRKSDLNVQLYHMHLRVANELEAKTLYLLFNDIDTTLGQIYISNTGILIGKYKH